MIKDNPKVSCVMCTYGRFQCVERSINFYIRQDYENKELIIFNTAPHPLYLSDKLLERRDITIINQQIDLDTRKPFTNIGDVRKSSLNHTTGDLYICWDDDDIFLPFHISQSIDGLRKSGTLGWKPKKSYFSRNGGHTFEYAENNMEASIIIDLSFVKENGFLKETGSEHLGWLDLLRKRNELTIEEVTPFESYCFNWGDSFAPHKQSGNIGDPNNFENHKKASVDFGINKELSIQSDEYINQYYINIYHNNPINILAVKLNKYLSNKIPLVMITPPPGNLYATHIEVLDICLSHIQPDLVVEYGMGDFSTNLLLQNSKEVISIEMQNVDWYKALLRRHSKCANWLPLWNPDPQRYADIDMYLQKDPDFVFVDGHQDTRPECINHFNNRCNTIVTHDTEDRQYGWERIKLDPEYIQFDFKKYPNWTTVFTKDQTLIEQLKTLL